MHECTYNRGANKWTARLYLRDSGFSKAAARMQYVKPEQYTNEYEHLILMDGTCRTFPKAKLFVDTLYYSGELEVIAIDNPVADLIIGNVEHMEVEGVAYKIHELSCNIVW